MTRYIDDIESYGDYKDKCHSDMNYSAIGIEQVKLVDCIIGECFFDTCTLEEFELHKTTLENIEFVETHLEGWEVADDDSSLYKCIFSSATVNNGFFENTYFNECEFKSGVIISGTCFENVVFKNCTFKDVRFENCSFRGCSFEDCEFEGDHSYLDHLEDIPGFKVSRVEFKHSEFTHDITDFEHCQFNRRTTSKGHKISDLNPESSSVVFTKCDGMEKVLINLANCKVSGLDRHLYNEIKHKLDKNQHCGNYNNSYDEAVDYEEDETEAYEQSLCGMAKRKKSTCWYNGQRYDDYYSAYDTHNPYDKHEPAKSKKRAYRFSTLGN